MTDSTPAAAIHPIKLLPVAAVLLLLYGATMPRGLTWDLGGADGGELAAAALQRGLVHSPGYPTYLLMAQPAILLPLDPPALRLQVLSALCTALAGWLIAWAGAQILAPHSRHLKRATALCGGAAGLFFGFMPVVWTQAVIVEVYALAALFCAALLALTLWADQAPNAKAFHRRLLPLGGCAGLGLGSHYMILIMMLFAALYLAVRRYSWGLHRHSLGGVGAAALGLAIFAYLPLRAEAVPYSNWGSPDTLERFIWVVSGAAYTHRFDAVSGLIRLPSAVGVLVSQLSIPGVALASLGMSWWWEAHRSLLWASLITILLNLWIVAGYGSADTLPYLYPALILLVLAAGSGLYLGVFRWLSRTAARLPMLVGTVCLTLGLLAWASLEEVSQARIDAETYGRQVIAQAESGALILSNDERHTFSIRYAAAAGVGGGEVILLDVRLLQYDWYREDLVTLYPQLGLTMAEVGDPAGFDAADLIAAIPAGIPVYFTYPPDLPREVRIEAMNGLYRVRR